MKKMIMLVGCLLLCSCNINSYNIINTSFKRTYNATENEVIRYVNTKIAYEYCLPNLPNNSNFYDFCAPLLIESKYSEEIIDDNLNGITNLTISEIISMEEKLIKNSDKLLTETLTFKENGIVIKELNTPMEYIVLNSKTTGTYKSISKNTYYYEIDNNNKGTIEVKKNYLCINECNNKYVKE